MTRTPCPAGHPAALALRLSEAALESTGWTAVARALDVEAGPGVVMRFLSGDDTDKPAATGDEAPMIVSVPGLGAWSISLPGGRDDALVPAVPLRETLAFATRLREGRPLEPSELEVVLDPLPYGALLLDGTACLLFANTAGEDLLTSRRLFRPTRPGAPLSPAHDGVQESLGEAVARVLHENGPGERWRTRMPDGAHLAVRLQPVGPARPTRGAARILLTLRAIARADTGPVPDA